MRYDNRSPLVKQGKQETDGLAIKALIVLSLVLF